MRLAPEVTDRATYCYPDSTFDPDDFGGPEVLERLCTLADDTSAADPLNDYVEAQVHGGVHLGRDVAALVLDPCHADSPVREAAERLGRPIEFHPGYRAATGCLPAGYRGPKVLALAQTLGPELTPEVVAAARRTDSHDPQAIKRVWHLLARFGQTRP